MFKLLVFITVLLQIVGCSSVPIKTSDASLTTNILSSDLLLPSNQRTEKIIVVYDDLSIPAFDITIYYQGKQIAILSEGEKVVFYAKLGVIQFGWSAISESNYHQQEFIITKELKSVFHILSQNGNTIKYVREI